MINWNFIVVKPQEGEAIRTNLYVSAEQVTELLLLQQKYFRERHRGTLIECQFNEKAYFKAYQNQLEKLMNENNTKSTDI